MDGGFASHIMSDGKLADCRWLSRSRDSLTLSVHADFFVKNVWGHILAKRGPSEELGTSIRVMDVTDRRKHDSGVSALERSSMCL